MHHSFVRRAATVGGLLVLFVQAQAAGEDPFEEFVAPIIVKRCLECHQGSEPSGGLDLTQRAGLMAGGESGAVINDEALLQSYLWQRVEAGEMPPERLGQSQKLSEAELQVLRQWIADGAPWPEGRTLDWFERTNDVRGGRDWWAFQPIVKPQPPRLDPQPSSSIDAFVQARLRTAGLSSAPRASRRVLIRRLYYDLLGLPPSETEIAAFLAETSEDAWPKLVNGLLERPQYGERWARYWLDLARFAETSGYERDQEKPFAWKYRDWVVKAFNDDMPYRNFIIQQLAGDEIGARTEASVIATGFLRLGTWNDEPNEPLDYQYDRLEDLVHTTTSAFIGLTVKCARCHAHKFDAIRQEDYYRVASVFWGGPIAPRGSSYLGGPSAEELGVDNVLGWTDLTPLPPPLRMLKNGERHKPLQIIAPASLSTIPALERSFDSPGKDVKTTQRRLQFAEWIADPKNPLTPRVLVNRLWQHHFGAALVRTPNNFGFLSDPPTHPQLLDWLASEFLESGGSIKAIHRLILNSEVWRQASVHPQEEEYALRDSANRLWWRTLRRRLDAEALRDSLLVASGELDLKLGGPSFKPTISPEALEGLSKKAAAWQASPPEQQNRRSLYVYMKRGLLPPMMTTFDLCDPTLSCGQRDVTTVPTQALAMLNNQFVHDRSRELAASVLQEADEVKSQIRTIWSRTLKRQPDEQELELALLHLEQQADLLQESKRSKPNVEVANPGVIRDSLVLHLRADRAQSDSEGKVLRVPDLSGREHHASQPDADARPELQAAGFAGRPILRFDGRRKFLRIAGQVLDDQPCTIICIVNDEGNPGHREIISNWEGSSNSTTSMFLGLTSENTVRFSDAFASAGYIADRQRPFLLTAVNGTQSARVYQNGALLNSLSAPLPRRKLDTEWIIGQQGNINGEFWRGGIAEVRVYERPLSTVERTLIHRRLSEEYGLHLPPPVAEKPVPLELLTLASLCHVLMNSNEFLYVD